MNTSHFDDNRSQSSHFPANQPHNVSQRYLTQTQRTGVQSQTQYASYMPSNNQSQNQSDNGSVTQGMQLYSYDIEKLREDFYNFINEFEVPVDEENIMQEENQKKYLERLQQMRDRGEFFFMIDASDIYSYKTQLYNLIINFPAELICQMDIIVQHIYRQKFGDENADVQQESQNILVGLNGLRISKRVRDIAPKDINKLISVKGIVIRCSGIFPEMKSAVFQCSNCARIEVIQLKQGAIDEPTDCVGCRQKFSFVIKHNQCGFTDKQFIKIQETPESIPEGETPQSSTLIAYDQNVDFIKPGDRIECVGILRAQSIRQNKNKRTIRSVFDTSVDVISFQNTNTNKIQVSENDNIVYSQEQIQQFQEIADHPYIYDKLVRSLAPSIWEHVDVKKGILAQLFGGKPKNFEKTGKGRFRAEINCLLLGDPSVAKSQLLQYVHKIAPRGIYTSGKGSSAVGLTAYITRDPETKEIVLESGALVLSDLGICCIDEFDKMDDNTRSILLEAMEQQTISIARAGIVAQLNARTAVLAGANPIESKYNPKKSVIENINLSAPLLSRFDLIYIMLDNVNKDNDTKLSNHIMNLFCREVDQVKIFTDKKGNNNDIDEEINSNNNFNGDQEEDDMSVLTREQFADYLSYARNMIKPQLTEEAVQSLEKQYCDLRKTGQSKNVIVCTTRQLESAIRISEANAKMRLRNIVTKEDVDEAYRLIKVSSQSAATDPTTGIIDIDLITTGQSAVQRENVKKIEQNILQIKSADPNRFQGNGIDYQELKRQLEIKFGPENASQLKDTYIEKAIRSLKEEGVIHVIGHDKIPSAWKILSVN